MTKKRIELLNKSLIRLIKAINQSQNQDQNQDKSYKRLFHEILQDAHALLESDYSSILTVAHDENDINKFFFYRRATTDDNRSVDTEYRAETGVIYEAVVKEDMVYVPDVSQSKTYKNTREETKSELTIPFRNQSNEVVGVVNFESDYIDHFDDELRALAQEYIAIIEVVYNNNELVQRADTQANIVKTLREIDQAIIRQTPEDAETLTPTMKKILRSALDFVGGEQAQIYVMNYQDQVEVVYEAFSQNGHFEFLPPYERPIPTGEDYVPAEGRGIVGWVAKNQKPYRTKVDAQEDENYIKARVQLITTHSEIAAPLIDKEKDRVVGVINLETSAYSAYQDEDLKTIEIFAGQTLIAVNNLWVRLRAIERFKGLRAITTELNSIVQVQDKEQAYDIVTRGLKHYLQCGVIFYEYDEFLQEFNTVANISSKDVPEHLKTAQELAGYVAEASDSLIINDMQDIPSALQDILVDDKNMSSLFAVRINRNDDLYGVIVLWHRETNHFSSSDQRYVELVITILAQTLHRLYQSDKQKRGEILDFVVADARLLSHELKNHIIPIKVRNQFIQDEIEKFTEDVGGITTDLIKNNEAVDHVTLLIREQLVQLDDFDNFQFYAFNLADLIKLTLKNMRSQSPDIAVNVHIPDDLPMMWCHPNGTRYVLENLFSNAKHAVKDRTNPLIELTAQEVENLIQIRVRDNGTGISEKHRAKIFNQRFSTKEEGLGTGRGLWLSKIRIEQMNGRLELLHTEVGIGTTFQILLPKATPEQIEQRKKDSSDGE